MQRVLWSTMSASRMKAAVAALRAAGDEETFKGFEDADGEMPMMSPDAEIVAAVETLRTLPLL